MFVAQINSSSKEKSETLKFILKSLKRLIDFLIVSFYGWYVKENTKYSTKDTNTEQQCTLVRA